MNGSRAAVMTLAMGRAVENLDYTFNSFQICGDLERHAFILGTRLPEKRLPGINYHLVEPSQDFSHPLREVYFRRIELIDELGCDFALVVDSLDVLCMQELPRIPELLKGAALAGCVEHAAGRYILGQNYTANFLNCGVMFWDVAASRKIRQEVVARGRARFRNVVDDQFCLNEVVQTKYYDRLRILPCQYNYRGFVAPRGERGWPTVQHLDGVMIYHNAHCIDLAKKLLPVRKRAELPELEADPGPLTPSQQLWRRFKTRLQPHLIR